MSEQSIVVNVPAPATNPADWSVTGSGKSWSARHDGLIMLKATSQKDLKRKIAEVQVAYDRANIPAPVVAETTTPDQDAPIVVSPEGDATPDQDAGGDAPAPVAGMFDTLSAIVVALNGTDAAPVVPEGETTTTEDGADDAPRATSLEEQAAELAAMETTEVVVNAKAANYARKGETAAEADARLKAYRAAKKFKHSMAWQLFMVADFPEGMTLAEARAKANAIIAAGLPCDDAHLGMAVPAPAPAETTTEGDASPSPDPVVTVAETTPDATPEGDAPLADAAK
jgi:hypothetical protein